MLTAEGPSSSCKGSSATHPLSFSQKRKEKRRKRRNMYNTQQQSIVETNEMQEQ